MGEKPGTLKGKTMLTSPPTTKPDHKLPIEKLEAQLRQRKAPIAEPLPLHNTTVAKWFGVAAGLMFIAGYACFPIARMIDPAAKIFADNGTTASALLICGFITCCLSLAMGMVAMILLLCSAWCQTYLREMKEGIYYARWTCTKEEWQTYVDDEINDLRGWPRAASIFFSIVGLVCGFVSVSAWPVQTPTSTVYLTAVGVFFGFMAAGWIFGKTLQMFQHRSLHARRESPEAPIIGLTGFYFNKQLHVYRMPGRRLHKFKFSQKGELHLFEFQFQQMVENGYDYQDVRIPIPATKLAEAECVYWMIRRSTGLGEFDAD